MSPAEMALNLFMLTLCLWSTWAGIAQVLRHRTVDGVSMTTVLMSLWACIGWGTYGWMHGYALQVLTNGAGLLATCLTLFLGYRYGMLRLRPVCWLTLGWTATVWLFIGIGGSAGYALVLSLLVFVLRLPQTYESWRNPGGLGVSVSSHVLAAIQSLGWVAYSMVATDLWMIVISLYCMAQSVFVIARTLQGRRVRSHLLPQVEDRPQAAAA